MSSKAKHAARSKYSSHQSKPFNNFYRYAIQRQDQKASKSFLSDFFSRFKKTMKADRDD